VTTRVPDRSFDPARARFLRVLAACASALAWPAKSLETTRPAMLTRPIPVTREPLPVVGCGTYIGFDVDDDGPEFERLRAVVRALVDTGGSVLDSSPMYGRAERVTGALLARDGLTSRAFIATKVWTSGRAAGAQQLETSLRLLRKRPLDLVQIHNLLDWRAHLPTLREAQRAGTIRYVGVSHYTPSAYRELEAVLRAERLDFLQVNYAMDDREAEERILPLAADRGVAVLVNRPFGGGGLLRRLGDQPLPTWANEIGATSWAQVLLKFVLSHPAVTCVIPGSGNPAHMADNATAGIGPIPDASFWKERTARVLG
jgi:diketogulonate reductase-like aldo/keto reductase